jgi:hypothetical protein
MRRLLLWAGSNLCCIGAVVIVVSAVLGYFRLGTSYNFGDLEKFEFVLALLADWPRHSRARRSSTPHRAPAQSEAMTAERYLARTYSPLRQTFALVQPSRRQRSLSTWRKRVLYVAFVAGSAICPNQSSPWRLVWR